MEPKHATTTTSPYHDWPLMHDPMSILLWLRDAKAYPEDDKSWWSDTSDTDQDSNNDSELDGTGSKSVIFQYQCLVYTILENTLIRN